MQMRGPRSVNRWETYERANGFLASQALIENTVEEQMVALDAIHRFAPLPANAHITARAELKALLGLEGVLV